MACGAVLGGRVQKQVCLKHPRLYGEHNVVHTIASCVFTTSQRRRMCKVRNDSSSSERQLRSLDDYFDKLHDDVEYLSIVNKRAKLQVKNKELAAERALESLQVYKDTIMGKSQDYLSNDSDGKTLENPSYTSARVSYGGAKTKKLQNYVENSDEDISSLYLIGTLASINVGVFLFEIASPVRNAELELFSIPSLYGAKINELILVGEWWRLVTPMFLHSGVLHMALGTWLLLSFGPPVCRAYGSVTFFLMYVLGGISGNLISFLHTPEPTVGGTGPIFALIGAWLVYRAQNRDIIEKEGSGSMFWKAIVATALSFVLSSFGHIDDWSHFGATVAGVVYGYLACPTLEMDNASSEGSRKEGITLVKQSADTCKSVAYFSLLVLLLCSLLLVVEPPLGSVTGFEF